MQQEVTLIEINNHTYQLRARASQFLKKGIPKVDFIKHIMTSRHDNFKPSFLLRKLIACLVWLLQAAMTVMTHSIPLPRSRSIIQSSALMFFLVFSRCFMVQYLEFLTNR